MVSDEWSSPEDLAQRDREAFLALLATGVRPEFFARLRPAAKADPGGTWTAEVRWRLQPRSADDPDGTSMLEGLVFTSPLKDADRAEWARTLERAGWRPVAEADSYAELLVNDLEDAAHEAGEKPNLALVHGLRERYAGVLEQQVVPAEWYSERTLLGAAINEAQALEQYLRARRTRDLVFATADLGGEGDGPYAVATNVSADVYARLVHLVATGAPFRGPGEAPALPEGLAMAHALIRQLQRGPEPTDPNAKA